MPTIPDPEILLEIALSAGRSIEDREWKQYQRYLAKYQQQHGDNPDEPPLDFEEFCASRPENRDNLEDAQ